MGATIHAKYECDRCGAYTMRNLEDGTFTEMIPQGWEVCEIPMEGEGLLSPEERECQRRKLLCPECRGQLRDLIRSNEHRIRNWYGRAQVVPCEIEYKRWHANDNDGLEVSECEEK